MHVSPHPAGLFFFPGKLYLLKHKQNLTTVHLHQPSQGPENVPEQEAQSLVRDRGWGRCGGVLSSGHNMVIALMNPQQLW